MKFAVIGAGMMGSAIITGIVNNKVLQAEEIFISDPDTVKCEQLKARLENTDTEKKLAVSEALQEKQHWTVLCRLRKLILKFL